MSQCVAVCPQLRFQVGAQNARAKGGQLGFAVQVDESVQTRQVDVEHWLTNGVLGNCQMTDHAGSTAHRYHRRATALGVLQQFAHMLGAFWERNSITHSPYLAAAHLQPIGQAMAQTVAQAGLDTGVHQRMGGQTACWNVSAGLRQCGVGHRCTSADALCQKLQRLGLHHQFYAVITPTVPPFHQPLLAFPAQQPLLHWPPL